MELQVNERIRLLRESGQVQRCHTIPTLGSYDIAQHCWHAVNLLLILRPDATLDMVKRVLWHDCAERWVGDFPATFKWQLPHLGKELQVLENKILDSLSCKTQLLPPLDEQWCEIVDKLELWLWTFDQVALGNQNALSIRANLEKYFAGRELPGTVRQILNTYTWSRSHDTIPGQ